MYANNNPWGPSSTSDSSIPANNPFLENSAANRFPAIDSSGQRSFQSSPPYPSQSPLGVAPSQFQQQSIYGGAFQQHMGWNGQPQPQSPGYTSGAFSGYGGPQQQLQPTGYAPFGQQQYESPYGLQSQSSPQYSDYPQYHQQHPTISPQQYQEYQQNAISQFDPYGSSASGPQNQSQSSSFTNAPPLQRTGPSGQPHPRQYIQSHKVELESWDPAGWKQALLTFEELKRSWETRRAEIQRQLVGGHYLTSEDVSHLNGLARNAESNIDSVVASLIQMQEVHSGYKHSLDAASKRRVREALNAGLQGLPEWP